jgi:hypothetical protein
MMMVISNYHFAFFISKVFCPICGDGSATFVLMSRERALRIRRTSLAGRLNELASIANDQDKAPG